MYLAIEIGGTKLQLAIGAGDRPALVDLRRYKVEPADGAGGILRQIEAGAGELLARHEVRGIGVGFGGPVEGRAGRVIKSHHVDGWEGFELAEWCRKQFDLPAAVGNDCDVAGLAEARFGAGQGSNPVFYVTVGTGIGGGFIVDGDIYHGHGHAAAELGHLRPGPEAELPEQTLESLASGWGIAAQARRVGIAHQNPERMQELVGNAHPTARDVAEAAAAGNPAAREVLAQATTALGWGIAQVITLLSPEVIVLGGGVSLIGEELFFAPVRQAVKCYVFPPLRDSYRIATATFGEEVVLHGALALADATHNI